MAMMETLDHATIARFVVRHEAALGERLGQVLRLCDEAGLVRGPGWWPSVGRGLRATRGGTRTASLSRSRGRSWRRRLTIDEAAGEQFGEVVGSEPAKLRPERVVGPREAVKEDGEWPIARSRVVKVDFVQRRRGVLDTRAVGSHRFSVRRGRSRYCGPQRFATRKRGPTAWP